MDKSTLYKDLMDNIPAAFFRCACDDHWTMHHMSEGLHHLTGYTAHELVGNHKLAYASLIHPDDSDSVDRAVFDAVDRRTSWNIEYRLKTREGVYKWVSELGMGVYNDDGKVEYLDGFVTDISQRKAVEHALHRSEQRIRELAYYDSVTGLPNRNLMLDQIETQLRSSTTHKPLGLLFIDLDGFKAINDVYGHETGDTVLATIGQRLRDLVTAPMLASRIGGDEFLVLCSGDITEEQCQSLGNDIAHTCSQPIAVEGMTLSVGASIGVSFSNGNIHSAKRLISAADEAMYHAKNTGKGRTVCFSEIDTSARAKQLETLEAEMVRALKEKQFELHYQPQINTRTGDVDSVEALIRWVHPEKGLLLPDSFIPAAEESGLIFGIGNWVLESAIAQIAAWQTGTLAGIRVSVNIAACQFVQGNICGHILSLLDQHSVPPSLLEIEVTESIFLNDTDAAASQLTALQDAGVRIAIDDFGTGFSCLSYLQDLPLDVLKIDRSFVERLTEDEHAHSVVNIITQLADGLGLETVAEGVETSEQSAEMMGMGCNLVQGFYFAEPHSPDHLSAVVERIRSHAAQLSNTRAA